MNIKQLAELLKMSEQDLKNQLDEQDEVIIDLNEREKPKQKENMKIEII